MSTMSTITFLLIFSTLATARFNVTSNFRVDVHTHFIPDFYREALINSGNAEIRNGTEVWSEGAIIPKWSIEAQIETMDTNGIDYSVLSLSAPGVAFLHGNPAAANLTRRLNDYLFELMELYQGRIGAFCVLPLPNVEAALEEIEYCMDTLGFAGVGLFTNHDGVYLGDSNLDPIFDLLSTRNLTTFVHPTVPNCWKDVTLGYAPPLIEFPFDTMRAIMNLFLTGTRARYQHINMIFSHGGGVLPFLAERVAYTVERPAFGGYRSEDVLDQFKGYFFDTASTVSRPQLAALDEFGVAGRLMTGTDYPFLPGNFTNGYPAAIAAYGKFTEEVIEGINSQNALSVLPVVVEKLGLEILYN
ncbi:uncharacterized protein LAJ45_02519 [Morchella importuna]|uniref:uncharacterized protein n=1 Tax=Morchella importuna TaxID=1174673 RepID=UPI001E8D2770|nr:uncharacterized protein LAJ45_02519 [Morchella importuna]KAH8153706.1 hypothetical protein LAJ45_02519 [Morchella importuna]